MSGWFPLHCHSDASILDGLSRPEQLVDRLKECGYAGCALTDHATLSGQYPFFKKMKEAGLKAIAGCELNIVADHTDTAFCHLSVLARNQQGWNNLVAATSAANAPARYRARPRLTLEEAASFAQGSWLVYSGQPGSSLANACFVEPRRSYGCHSYEEARAIGSSVRPDWEKSVLTEMDRLVDLFGRDSVYIELSLLDEVNMPASRVVGRILRHCAAKRGLPCFASCDSHYCRSEDWTDHHVHLAGQVSCSIRDIGRKLEQHPEDLRHFFRSSRYHLPSLEEVEAVYSAAELDTSLQMAARCETPCVSRKPLLPVFPCPGGISPDDYLRQLCRQGWKQKIEGRVGARRAEYAARVRTELDVLLPAGLSSYFLIVQDFIAWAKQKLGARTGRGRGSAAGCLVSYLIGITRIDPVRFDLVFERFYNAGRNTAERVSMPDIDTDFASAVRDLVVDYLREKYGHDRVCQMATFGTRKGRSAIKAVLSAHARCSPAEMQQITDWVPDPASISDDLQDMVEAGEDASVIMWALENNAAGLRPWCHLTEEGQLEGPLALDFAQAIRLEGVRANMGKHASGVIICSERLSDVAPMVYDEGSGELMVDVDMRDAEDAGLMKFDLLATTVIDKTARAEEHVRAGRALRVRS